MLLLAPLFVVRARRFQRQLYRAGAGADRVQRRLRRAADAGRLPGRPHRRPRRADRRAWRVSSVAYAVAGIVDSYWVFIAMYGLAGLGNTVFHPADYSLLSHHAPPERLGQVFSFHTFAGIVGSAIAPVTLLYMQSVVRLARRLSRRVDFRLRSFSLVLIRAARAGRRNPRLPANSTAKARAGRRRCRLARAADAADPAQPRLLHSCCRS